MELLPKSGVETKQSREAQLEMPGLHTSECGAHGNMGQQGLSLWDMVKLQMRVDGVDATGMWG